MGNQKWYEVNNVEHITSPSLLLYPKRIVNNIQTMIEIAGGTNRLRPHVKTHKMAEVIQLKLNYGINKFKCSTVSEAALLAKSNAKDILLAIQPVGPNIHGFLELIKKYPDISFSTIVDTKESVNEIGILASDNNLIVSLYLDINNGMNRSGVRPGDEAISIYQLIESNPNLKAQGLHVYDGHIHESNFNRREKLCNEAFEPVEKLKTDIENSGMLVESIVAGGTPTFPIHIKRKNVEVSPGTPLLWDQGYSDQYKDLNFLTAAAILTRVISKPKKDYLCLDLGHKSIAAEMSFPRARILNLSNVEQIGHSEEHMVIRTNEAENYRIGDVFYAIPTHICPTVCKYNRAHIIENGDHVQFWLVEARDHELTEELY